MIRSTYRRMAVLPVLCCALLVLFAARSEAQATQGGKLTVRVTGFHNTDGNLLLQVRSDPNTVIVARAVEIDGKTMSAQVVFDNLPEGTYGVFALHDPNKNGRFDFDSMGMPVEGYGHSNNPAKREGPPDFNETKFTLGKTDVTIEIKLIYWP